VLDASWMLNPGQLICVAPDLSFLACRNRVYVTN